MISPLPITSTFVLGLHVPLCRLLVYKSVLGFLGGALAEGLSNWLYVVFLWSTMWFFHVFKHVCPCMIFNGVGEFFVNALLSTTMVLYFYSIFSVPFRFSMPPHCFFFCHHIVIKYFHVLRSIVVVIWTYNINPCYQSRTEEFFALCQVTSVASIFHFLLPNIILFNTTCYHGCIKLEL